jgi:ribose-phosphate pyrophosphokinase
MDGLPKPAESVNLQTPEGLMEYIRLAVTALRHPLKIFCLNGTREYGQRVVKHLQIPLAEHVEKNFEDDECYLKSVNGEEGNVRGHDVFVIQSLYSDDNESVCDKFMKLLIFCGSLRQASAHTITVVIPHMAWARQDRKTESRAPVTTKLLASMLESVGVDRIMTIDVHNLSAFQNAPSIRCQTDHLEAKSLFVDWCAERLETMNAKKIVVLSPDVGGIPRIDRFRNALGKKMGRDIGTANYDKVRRVDGELVGNKIIGDIADAEVIGLDDMISTGGTMVRAAEAVPRFGGRLLCLCATHGLFVGKANAHLDKLDTQLVVADTVRPWRLTPANRKKIVVVDTSELLAKAIWRIHTGTGSISQLLQ